MRPNIDFFVNGQGFVGPNAPALNGSNVAGLLMATNMDPGVLRPWIDPISGQTFVSLNSGQVDDKGEPIQNNITIVTPGTLLKEEWIKMDDVVLRSARPQMKVWNAIVGAGLTYDIPNGMSVPILQHQTTVDYAEATFSMDGLREGKRDRPQFDLGGLPLPIVHSDFSFSLREVMISRRGGTPLDTAGAEMAGRRVAEAIEKITLGTLSSYAYGGYTVYGLTNFSSRVTKTFTLPTAAGWTPQQFISEVLDAIQSLQNTNFNGPYGMLISPAWTKYLEDDYSAAYPGVSLRDRLRRIADIRFVEKVDYMGISGTSNAYTQDTSVFQIVLFQLTPDVVRAVSGMDITTLQWESHAGLQLNFKVMGIKVPQVRVNADGNCGIVHCTAA